MIVITERLYYRDCYLTGFQARVVETAPGGRVYLDRTAFYPDSGGQPADAGTLGGAAVVDVVEEGERICHAVDGPVPPGVVEGRVDWTRRFDHMQQHSGQHLLSAVLVELFEAPTLSFHLGRDSSTIEIGAATLSPGQIAAAELRANQVVFEDRPLSVSFEHAAEAAGLRKASQREGELRIIAIEGLDRSACGGTHVRRSGEIGPLVIRRLDRIRGHVRLEFLCGGRALERARADFAALNRIAQVFSSSLDEAPALVAAQQARLSEAEKTARKLATELARLRGRELYQATAPAGDGVRRAAREIAGALDEVVRAEVAGFLAGGKALYLAWSRNPCSLLLAASADAGADSGAVLKQALAAAGGRGGGTAQMAQGSLADPARLDSALAAIRMVLGW